MDEGNRRRGQRGFPQNRKKNNCRLYTRGKLTENKGILSTNEEKGRNIPYLSTSYQQAVDNIKIGTVDLEKIYLWVKKMLREGLCNALYLNIKNSSKEEKNE